MDLNLYFKKCFITIPLLAILLTGCNQNKKQSAEINDTSEVESDPIEYIEVTTTAMDFDIPSELQSGWTTFKYVNNSEEPHFFIFEKMPEGITIDNYNNELVPPFKAAFTYLLDENVEAAMKEFEKVPDWWSKVKLGGGVGLISPHRTAESTIYLNPGIYVMECYVRMPNGMPHAFFGMLKQIVVTDDISTHQEPKADFEISVSSEKGVSFVDSLEVGNYSLAVNFEDQKLYETLLGHDINLVKLDNLSLLDTLGKWVNAADIKAFRSPAPVGLTFLGGVEDLEAGKTGYFNVELKEGDYVLISEVPNTIQRNMFKTFKVYK